MTVLSFTKKIIQFLNPVQKKNLIWIIIFSFILVILDFISLIYLYQFVQNILILKDINNYSVFKHGTIVILLFAIRFISHLFIQKFNYKVIYDICKLLSLKLFKYYFKSNFKTFRNFNFGKITHRVIGMAGYIGEGYLINVISFLVELFCIIILIVGFAILYFKLFLLCIISFFPFFLIIIFIKNKKLNLFNQKIGISNENLTKHTMETYKMYLDIKISNQFDKYLNQFNLYINDLHQLKQKNTFWQFFGSKGIEFSISIGFIIMVILLFNFFNLTIATSSLIIISILFFRIFPGLSKTSSHYSAILYNYGIMKPFINELISEVDNHEKPFINQLSTIECKNLSFKYDNHLILNQFNFRFEKGKIYGISAPSGKGKTTLAYLISGLESPTDGQVIFNNSFKSTEYQTKTSYVFQQPYLLNDSIENNITLGNEMDIELFNKIILDCEIDSWINNLQGGKNYIIGDNGINISGGQRQRLALARALYLKSELLILDETFTGLENDVSTQIMLNLKNIVICNSLICIIISHQNHVLDQCDDVIVL